MTEIQRYHLRFQWIFLRKITLYALSLDNDDDDGDDQSHFEEHSSVY